MISVTMVAKVGEETILETALVSLLPDLEVEVQASSSHCLILCDQQEISCAAEAFQDRDLQKVFIS